MGKAHEPGQLAHDTAPGDRGVQYRHQALPGHVIDHIEYPRYHLSQISAR